MKRRKEWKQITLPRTGEQVRIGDTVRYHASPDPTSLDRGRIIRINRNGLDTGIISLRLDNGRSIVLDDAVKVTGGKI